MSLNKKSGRVLSALSMAAVAALTGRVADAVTLTLFYGQDSNYANSNNAVMVGSSFNPGSHVTDAVGENQYLTNVTLPAVSQGNVTTITMPVGSYLSLAIDAVLTGNPNDAADAGQMEAGQVQPSYLGLAELSMRVASSDSTASFLTPLARSTKQLSTYKGTLPTYIGSAVINHAQGPNGASNGNVPNWTGIAFPADVAPNEPGYDQGNGNGNFGLNGETTGATSTLDASTATGATQLQSFAPQNNVASYATATDFEDSVMFQALNPGVVTLSPSAVGLGSTYWYPSTTGSTSSAATYTTLQIKGADIIHQVPSLVIDITEVTVPEPASLGLLAAGGIALLARQDRRKE